MALSLISSDFADGARIPERFTRLGENVSPPLQWSSAPEATKAFALIVEDPDAPDGVFRHWASHDIPPDRAGLELGEAGRTDLPQARNDFDNTGYDGPEPPAGHGAHRYCFRLFALDTPSLELPSDPGVRSVAEAASPHVLEEARLTGRYERGSKQMRGGSVAERASGFKML